ncbi:uncharacterized protein LOC125657040 [Ostrea edulis]|uniref:uncharacterized protein LOC125657040 n=1 Tax=Ostrea edulis TaxID=37623 RepID=UPI0020964A40|nr:uncharacterized protein LOC125657040 [Ostrea edulis]
MTPQATVLALLNAWIVSEVASWEVCRNDYSLSATSTYLYCEHGCCGYTYEQYCCADNIGLIVGCAFGGLVFLGVVAAVVFCCIQKNKQKRTAIRPLRRRHTPGTMAIISNGSHCDPNFKHVLKPPPYTMDPPPAYSEIVHVSAYSASTSYKNDDEYTTTAVIHNENPPPTGTSLRHNVPSVTQCFPPGAVDTHSGHCSNYSH